MSHRKNSCRLQVEKLEPRYTPSPTIAGFPIDPGVSQAMAPAAATPVGLQATVVAISYAAASNNITLGVAVPKGIDNAARIGNADWGLEVTLTYVDGNGAIQTLDSGRLSLCTFFSQPLDNNTDLIEVVLQFNVPVPLPLPGNTPGFVGTAVLLHP
jgi:hypothetical protein